MGRALIGIVAFSFGLNSELDYELGLGSNHDLELIAVVEGVGDFEELAILHLYSFFQSAGGRVVDVLKEQVPSHDSSDLLYFRVFVQFYFLLRAIIDRNQLV